MGHRVCRKERMKLGKNVLECLRLSLLSHAAYHNFPYLSYFIT